MRFVIDSHCHLADPKFVSDMTEVLERALAAGITTMMTIADTMEEAIICQQIAEKYEHIFYTAGVHPHAAKDMDLARDLPILRTHAAQKKCRAIGEIGLDYHYMNSPKDIQQRVFEAQLALAKEVGLPAVVHTREAVEDTWTIVNHVNPKKIVIHCCTEKWEDVKRFVDAGYLLSFTGIITYPKSNDLRETVKMCPLESMMIETDAPYLAPESKRGQRNEPAFVREVAECIAAVKGIDLAEVDRVTSQNAINFFKII